MKKYKPLLLLLSLLTPKLVLAQQGDMLGGTSGIIVSIFELISIEITIPNIVSSAAYTGPLWILILGFLIAFSVIFLAAGKIPLFRDAPSKGPHKIFSIAVSLMIIFSTPFLSALLGLIGTFTSLSMIAVLILGIYTIWALFKGGWSEQSKALADANKISADADEVNREARQISDSAKTGISALDKEKSALDKIIGKSGIPFFRRKGIVELDIENNKKLVAQLKKISDTIGESSYVNDERGRSLVHSAMKDLSNAIGRLEGNTQRVVRRINLVKNILEKSEGEEKQAITAIKEVLIKHIEDFKDKTEESEQQIHKQLNELLQKFIALEQQYEQKITNVKKLEQQFMINQTSKTQIADELKNAINTKQIPPDSSGLIQKLIGELETEMSIDSQLARECEELEIIIDKLKKTEKQMNNIMNQEKKLVNKIKNQTKKIFKK
ncbi:hypothetical protein KO361_00695 [Candidatus Woesearchaeota archaeon]|nr:hypothetical protein [Candidatus Woesearchaeota archaeon]